MPPVKKLLRGLIRHTVFENAELARGNAAVVAGDARGALHFEGGVVAAQYQIVQLHVHERVHVEGNAIDPDVGRLHTPDRRRNPPPGMRRRSTCRRRSRWPTIVYALAPASLGGTPYGKPGQWGIRGSCTDNKRRPAVVGDSRRDVSSMGLLRSFHRRVRLARRAYRQDFANLVAIGRGSSLGFQRAGLAFRRWRRRAFLGRSSRLFHGRPWSCGGVSTRVPLQRVLRRMRCIACRYS